MPVTFGGVGGWVRVRDVFTKHDKSMTVWMVEQASKATKTCSRYAHQHAMKYSITCLRMQGNRSMGFTNASKAHVTHRLLHIQDFSNDLLLGFRTSIVN